MNDNYGEKSEMLFKLKPLPSMNMKLKKSRYLANNKYMDISIEIRRNNQFTKIKKAMLTIKIKFSLMGIFT